jgi:hypothetical protein
MHEEYSNVWFTSYPKVRDESGPQSTFKSAVGYTQYTQRDDFWREKFTHGLPEAAYRNMAPKVSSGGDWGYARDDLAWEQRGLNAKKTLNKGDCSMDFSHSACKNKSARVSL